MLRVLYPPRERPDYCSDTADVEERVFERCLPILRQLGAFRRDVEDIQRLLSFGVDENYIDTAAGIRNGGRKIVQQTRAIFRPRAWTRWVATASSLGREFASMFARYCSDRA